MSESFAELFEESVANLNLKPGTMVMGTVVDLSDDFVVVNAGLKSYAPALLGEDLDWIAEDGPAQITDYEPRRAAQYGIQHYTWMCINAKEAEDRGMAREVIAT